MSEKKSQLDKFKDLAHEVGVDGLDEGKLREALRNIAPKDDSDKTKPS